jgi:ATP-binding cassette subfamily B protein
MSVEKPFSYGMGRGMRSFLKDSSVTKASLPKGIGKRIWQFALPYRKILAIYLIVVVLDAGVSVANPLLYREIINQGILKHNKSIILIIAIVIALLAVFNALLALGQRYISAKVGEGLIFDMRSKVFDHIQRMPMAFFTRTQTGALVSRLNNDVIGAQQAFTDTLSSIAGNLIMVIFTMIAMAFLAWQITLVAILLLPVFLIPARRIGRRLQKLTRRAYDLNASMNNTMTERFNVAGALLVKLFGDPYQEISQFNQKAGAVRDIGVTTAMYGRIFFVSLTLCSSLATALVYGWGGVMAVDAVINVGTVVALASYLNRLYGPLTALSNVNVDIMTALVSFDRVFEVLDIEPLIKEKPNPIKIEKGPIYLEFKNVSFKYPTAQEVSLASLESVRLPESEKNELVLKDISFRVEPSKIVALVGPSGAGKTTISYLIPRLYDPTEGSVELNGIDLKDLSFESIRSLIAMVTQDPHMFHDTIRANLLFAKPDASDSELYDALNDAQLLELIKSLPDGLNTVVGDRGYRLSGGEKQRLAIARVLLREPELVVFDEATSHLDSQSEALIQKAFEQVYAGRAAVIIAHRLSTVKSADEILVINQGRIVQRGTHQELVSQEGLYLTLYNRQFANGDKPVKLLP